MSRSARRARREWFDGDGRRGAGYSTTGRASERANESKREKMYGVCACVCVYVCVREIEREGRRAAYDRCTNEENRESRRNEERTSRDEGWLPVRRVYYPSLEPSLTALIASTSLGVPQRVYSSTHLAGSTPSSRV